MVRVVNIPLVEWIVDYSHEYLLFSNDFILGSIPFHIQENGSFERRDSLHLVPLRR